jgi:phosphoribosylformimino-5-aminoimidazole carboxamide ribotide isomerase
MIFPAIDIMNGGCVRLLKGNFSDRINYDVSPFEMAKQFSAAGAEWIHIVDLDGAKDGKQAQSNLIIEIAQSCGISIQTGGGIRELNHVKKLIKNGVKRVVIGSLAVTNPDKVKSWIRELPNDSICIALDVNINERGIPYPAIRGWTEPNEKTLWNILCNYIDSGLETILVTDIEKDGAELGSNLSLYEKIQDKYPNLNLITSGGVGSIKHIKSLKALNPYGIIIGKALYENRFTLKQAINC